MVFVCRLELVRTSNMSNIWYIEGLSKYSYNLEPYDEGEVSVKESNNILPP